MRDAKFTPGPWKWQGEDYRGGWGWQLLVGPNGEGLMCGQDPDGSPCKHLRAYMAIDPELCKTGMMRGDDSVPPVHVMQADANLIKAAPDLYEALDTLINYGHSANWHEAFQPLIRKARYALAKARGDASEGEK